MSIELKIKLKSLGVLLCIVPIGAFVEPDEKQMEKISRRDRSRIFAAGLTTNIIFAIICAAIFSWGFMASWDSGSCSGLCGNIIMGNL